MNCKNCNSPLESQTRYCPQCGMPTTGNTVASGIDPTIEAFPPVPRSIEAESTLIASQQSMQPTTNSQPVPPQTQQAQRPQQQSQPTQLEQWPQPTQQPQWPQQMQPTQQPQWPQQMQPIQPTQWPQQTQQPQWPASGGNPQPQDSSYAPPDQPHLSAQTEPLLQGSTNHQATPFPIHTAEKPQKRAKRGSFGGCLLRLITILVLLLTILTGAWIFVLRPYVHGITENELNNALTESVNQIPTALSLIPLPPHTTLPITETALQNLIRLNIAPADPVQNPVVHINQQGVRLEFTVHQNFLSIDFNFPCAVSFLPAVDNQGNLIARNVNIEGIASLVMSPDEMTTLLNQQFSAAMKRINHTIASVSLQPGQIDITLN